jgi:hypothetical protein
VKHRHVNNFSVSRHAFEADVAWPAAFGVVEPLTMKPVAPPLSMDAAESPEPSLQTELQRACDEKNDAARITLPAPPSPETLRAATPCPPSHEESTLETIPAPPPSASRKRADSGVDLEAVPSTIPGPPRMPRIAGV